MSVETVEKHSELFAGIKAAWKEILLQLTRSSSESGVRIRTFYARMAQKTLYGAHAHVCSSAHN